MSTDQRFRKQTTRCWITSIELRLNEAWVIDPDVAIDARRDLAQRLAMLDKLLAEAGGPGGDKERRRRLGLKPHDQRVLSKLVVKMYEGVLQVPNLFVSVPEWRRRGWKRWRDEVRGDVVIRARFQDLSEDAWQQIGRFAGRIRNLMDGHAGVLLRTRVDALVAREAYLRSLDYNKLEQWLADTPPARLLELCAVPEERRRDVLPAFEWRQAVQRARLDLIDLDPQTRPPDPTEDE